MQALYMLTMHMKTVRKNSFQKDSRISQLEQNIVGIQSKIGNIIVRRCSISAATDTYMLYVAASEISMDTLIHKVLIDNNVFTKLQDDAIKVQEVINIL